MDAEIIAVGSELLVGGCVDTNSVFLTRALASLGIEVRYKSVVGDEEADIADVLRQACRRVNLVVLTGGLGPTVDDRTREAVARAVGRSLHRRAEALAGMHERLAQWGRVPSRHHYRQTRIPAGAEVLANPVGSAPGFLLRHRSRLVVALPGVPAEAEAMFAQGVMPRLHSLLASSTGVSPLLYATVQTYGLVESDVQARLHEYMRQKTVRFGLYASPLGVTVSLLARSGGAPPGGRRNFPDRARLVADTFQKMYKDVRRRLGPVVYGEGRETMEEIVGGLLQARGQMLALAESCTGGLIGHRLTQVPGVSACFDRGVVCYSNQSKQELLGISPDLIRKHGAVSSQVAAAMAREILKRSHADVALSTTGIAGPGGGTPKKPVGLVYIGVCSSRSPRKSFTRRFQFHGDRHMIKLRASQAALDLLRQLLRKEKGYPSA